MIKVAAGVNIGGERASRRRSIKARAGLSNYKEHLPDKWTHLTNHPPLLLNPIVSPRVFPRKRFRLGSALHHRKLSCAQEKYKKTST